MGYKDYVTHNKQELEIVITVRKMIKEKTEGFIIDLSCSGLPI
jgi:hypothetical protein